MTQQYVRQTWTIENGLANGEVRAIAQTPDGYLWIGTDKGLLRFDGFTFSSASFWPSTLLSHTPILEMITDGDGNLWIRLQGASVLRHSNGKLESVETGLDRAMVQVTAILRETNGGVLLADLMAGMVRFREEKSEVLAPLTIVPGSSPVIAMAETSDGKIWMGTVGAGLFYLSQGRATNVGSGFLDRKINCLLSVGGRELLVGTDKGLFRWNGTVLRKVGLPPSVAGGQVLALLADRDSNVWVGTTKGLLRINAKGTAFSDEKALRGNGGINTLFEDREGNIWAGGTRGLERIRDTAFVTYLPWAGLPAESSGPVYVDSDNLVWLAPAEGGLYSLKEGRVETIKSGRLDEDVIYSIAGSKGEVWLGRQRAGLTHLQYGLGDIKVQSYTQGNGLAQNSVYAVYQSHDGAVWAGTLSGGVSRFKNGRFTTYTTANGLASNTVNSILETSDGTIWLATPSGLSSLSGGNWRNYAAAEGVPSGSVNCLFEDSSGRLWAGTSNGLAFFSSGHIQVPGNLPDLLRGQVFGIAEDQNGWLWIATAGHILRVRREKLIADAVGPADLREYGPEDGLLSVDGVKRNKSVVSDASGRIWFSLGRGLSVVDPAHLTGNSAPAMVHVEAISADGTPINARDFVRVSASSKRITLRYTGLSFATPDRVRFRYFLEGFDRTWSEPAANREAVYTNLNAGSYRFRLVACNSDGLWNSAETVFPFEIEPLFWQRWWFRLSGALVIGLTILMFFRLRMLAMAKQMNIRFDERLAERTRIAQELHDTLLQGFLSTSMQLHVADDLLASDSPAKPLIGRVLELMGQVIEEGRNAVRGLRSSKKSFPDLEQALLQVRQEFPVQSQIGFRVIVEGAPRPLRPMIREEIYRIGHEALSNAFRHSHASDVEVELEYNSSRLRVLIRDNGDGIDPEVLQSGRDGHWGLSGMKERTERIGGKLRVLSHAGAGTEVELSVPGQLAFALTSEDGVGGWLSKLNRRKKGGGQPRSGSDQAQ